VDETFSTELSRLTLNGRIPAPLEAARQSRLHERKEIARALVERGVELHDLELQPGFGSLTPGGAFTADLQLPFPPKLAPQPSPRDPAPAPDAALPLADVLVLVSTIAEQRALADVLTPGYARGVWHRYNRGFEQRYLPQIRPGAPALRSRRLGSWMTTRVGSSDVLCFKTELHLSQDGILTGPGTATLPLKELLHQVLDEVRPRLVLMLGTAGALTADKELGDVIITRSAAFRCGAEYEQEPWNDTTFSSGCALPTAYLADAEELMRRHAIELIEPAFAPPTKRYAPETPLCMSEAANRPRVHLDGRDLPVRQPVLTCDHFAFGTTADALGDEGCAIELGDAVVGLACSERERPPAWATVRCISHPQINADLQSDPPRLDMQTHWTVWYEEAFGYWSSVMAAIAAWGLIAGLDD
jgi:hypothetical protein